MSVLLDDVATITRYVIGDYSENGVDIHEYGSDSQFTISEEHVISVSTVFVAGTEIGTSEWSYDSTTNKVTVIYSGLTSGDAVEIRFTYYGKYSQTLLQNYVRGALVHISTNNYKTFIVKNSKILPEPDDDEQNLIATIAGLIAEPDNRSIRLPDVYMKVPDDLPTHEKIRRSIAVFKKKGHGSIDIL